MKVLATWLPTNETYIFDNERIASKNTIRSVKRILWCINTGRRWKGWIFDYVAND